MKLVNNRVALTFLLVNVLFVAVGYFGLLNSAGYFYNTIGNFKYELGTPYEYWKLNIEHYYSMIYVGLLVTSYLVILLHKGNTPLSISISRGLKYQILLLGVIDLIIRLININHQKSYKFDEFSPENISLFYLLIPLVAAWLANRKKTFNMKLMLTTTLSCLAVFLILNLQKDILKSDIVNKLVTANLQFTKVGSPVHQYKPTFFGRNSLNESVATIETITNNYTNIHSIISYPFINKTTNKEIFEMVENMSTHYTLKDETYLKEKFKDNLLEDGFTGTKVYRYNKLSQLTDHDIQLLNTYKTKGVDEAMKEFDPEKRSFIGLLFKNKKEFDERI